MACSTGGKKANIPSNADPKEEISKLEVDIRTAISKNVDVLAPDEFENCNEWLSEARSDFAAKKNQEEILEDLRKSRGFLEQAYATSVNRESKAPGLFVARQAALSAGASSQPTLEKELKSVDSEVSSNASELENLKTDEIVKLQDQYINLERRAVILTQLGSAQAKINGARKDRAEKRAPLTLKKADLSLKNSESVISTNVRNPQGFQVSVAEANRDAAMLSDVMNTIKENGKSLSEAAAIKMVNQNNLISAMNTEKTNTANKTAADAATLATKTAADAENLANTNAADAENLANINAAAAASQDEKNSQLNSEIQGKDKDLTTANDKVEIQRVIEQARSEFKPDEAEAFQQGGKLVIRMKNVNFDSGRSDLPGASLLGLAKVSNIAKTLNASVIEVQGHTDSVGGESTNKAISEARASSVASYFKSNGFNEINVLSAGYGFSKPIATNKSKLGRAQNRRVDIIITPKTTEPTSL